MSPLQQPIFLLQRTFLTGAIRVASTTITATTTSVWRNAMAAEPTHVQKPIHTRSRNKTAKTTAKPKPSKAACPAAKKVGPKVSGPRNYLHFLVIGADFVGSDEKVVLSHCFIIDITLPLTKLMDESNLVDRESS